MGLRGVLTRNWLLKLTSLLLAVLLWLVAAAEEPASVTLPVRVSVQAPAGRTLLHADPTVTAILTGRRRDLFRLASERLVIVRRLADNASAQVEVAVNPGDVTLPRGIDAHVQDLHPRRLTVELDEVATRMVPIRPMLQVRPDSGFDILGGIVVEPAQVEITGPRERVLVIDTLYTRPFELDRLDGPAEQRLRVDTTGLEVVQVNPEVVTVRVTARPVTERTIAGVPVRLSSRAAESLRTESGEVSVVVRGELSRLATVTAESLMVTVAGDSLRPGMAPLRVFVPSGLSGRVRPDSVRLLARDTAP